MEAVISEESREFSARLTKIHVTSPEFEVRHYISDDELDLMCDNKPGAAKDICLVAVGGFLGAILPTFEQLLKLNGKNYAIGMVGLATFALSVAMLFLTIATGWLWKQSENQQKSVVSRIRQRPKSHVQ